MSDKCFAHELVDAVDLFVAPVDWTGWQEVDRLIATTVDLLSWVESNDGGMEFFVTEKLTDWVDLIWRPEVVDWLPAGTVDLAADYRFWPQIVAYSEIISIVTNDIY